MIGKLVGNVPWARTKALARTWQAGAPELLPQLSLLVTRAPTLPLLGWPPPTHSPRPPSLQVRALNAGSALRKALKTAEGREGLLKELQQAAGEDRSLALQLRVLLGGNQ